MSVSTRSNHVHFRTAVNFLHSLEKFEGETSVIVYDLGMKHTQFETLKSTFRNFEYRRFPFEDYPEHFSLKQNVGEYAWKPAIISKVC